MNNEQPSQHTSGAVLPLEEELRGYFGDNPDLLAERRDAYQELYRQHVDCYGHRADVFLVRAPARVNLKGMHIDHRGGHMNYVAIDREITLAVSPRSDDQVMMRDSREDTFGPRSLTISEALPPDQRGDWQSYIETADIVRGDWSNYIRAGVLKLQDRFPDRDLVGMDLLVDGNIPMASGLSSSSAMVVATVEACLQVNGLALSREEKALLCGEAEWYVGTRGGAGDHAAIIYGKPDHITRLQFFPLTTRSVPQPEGYDIVIFNSMVHARKSAGARSTFNERVATYEIAMMLIRKILPHHAEHLSHLRDFNVVNLGLSEPDLYRILKRLPVRISRNTLRENTPEWEKGLDRLFGTHDDPEDGYRVRAICLYGMAECERSSMFSRALVDGDMATAGRLMYLSHDGDRVQWQEGDASSGHQGEVSDRYLDGLITAAETEAPGSSMWEQPGAYGCSCEELDFIVDLCKKVPGVVGANLTGAGLGGCVVVMVAESETKRLLETVDRLYYEPRGLKPASIICRSVHGACRIG